VVTLGSVWQMKSRAWETAHGNASDRFSLLGSVVTLCSLFCHCWQDIQSITAAEFRSRLHKKASCLLSSCKMTLGEGSELSGNRGRSGSILSSSCHRDHSGRVPHHDRGRDPAVLFLLRSSWSCHACIDPAGCTCQISSSPCRRPAARSCGRLRPGQSSLCCRICSSRRPSPPSG